MRFSKEGLDENVRLDLTPLVDVVFLLIIFFMVSTTFVYQPTIKINLPSSTQPVTVNRNYINITIEKNGRVFLFDKKLENNNELLEILRREFENDPERVVLIKGDRDSRYENIVNVIDIVKKAGLKRILIATKSEAWKTN